MTIPELRAAIAFREQWLKDIMSAPVDGENYLRYRNLELGLYFMRQVLEKIEAGQ